MEEWCLRNVALVGEVWKACELADQLVDASALFVLFVIVLGFATGTFSLRRTK